ncbi:glycosyltransferase family 2 protein [Cerasicoccus arenae]|nr:glycosyltransferase family 2 protein [Cerasicoccus arenae]
MNLQKCLESVAFSDDVWVLDSQSSDQTVAIARSGGATVLTRAFDNYAAQRMYGLQQDFKHDWILMLDADERISPELATEIQSVIQSNNSSVTLYRVRRKDMFMGKWLRRSSGYPTWFGRLFRRGKVRVEREVNEEYYTDGKVGLLREHLIHYPFNKGIEYWITRHNIYSSMETDRLEMELSSQSIPWKLFLNKDPMLRRRALKQFAYRMPFRPFGAFIYLYIVRGGFLDGAAGFRFSTMRAAYEFMIDIKLQEARYRRKNEQG